MIQPSGIVVAYDPEGDLTQALSRLMGSECRFAIGVISCIDSLRFKSEADVARVFRNREMGGRIAAFGLVLPRAGIAALLGTSSILTGFDEMWFWEDAACVCEPPDIGLTTTHAIEDWDSGEREELGGWMMKHRCCLAMGDGIGCGLNVAAIDSRWLACVSE